MGEIDTHKVLRHVRKHTEEIERLETESTAYQSSQPNSDKNSLHFQNPPNYKKNYYPRLELASESSPNITSPPNIIKSPEYRRRASSIVLALTKPMSRRRCKRQAPSAGAVLGGGHGEGRETSSDSSQDEQRETSGYAVHYMREKYISGILNKLLPDSECKEESGRREEIYKGKVEEIVGAMNGGLSSPKVTRVIDNQSETDAGGVMKMIIRKHKRLNRFKGGV